MLWLAVRTDHYTIAEKNPNGNIVCCSEKNAISYSCGFILPYEGECYEEEKSSARTRKNNIIMTESELSLDLTADRYNRNKFLGN